MKNHEKTKKEPTHASPALSNTVKIMTAKKKLMNKCFFLCKFRVFIESSYSGIACRSKIVLLR